MKRQYKQRPKAMRSGQLRSIDCVIIPGRYGILNNGRSVEKTPLLLSSDSNNRMAALSGVRKKPYWVSWYQDSVPTWRKPILFCRSAPHEARGVWVIPFFFLFFFFTYLRWSWWSRSQAPWLYIQKSCALFPLWTGISVSELAGGFSTSIIEPWILIRLVKHCGILRLEWVRW